MTAAIVMRDETPAAATRWTLPEARDFETVNALIAAPLGRPPRGSARHRPRKV